MSMEVKINKDISQYTEKIFFGLSLRQMIFSALATASCVLLYFRFRTVLSKDLLSPVCAMGAAPFALSAFVQPQGLPMERYLLVWLTSSMTPRQLTYKAENTLYGAVQRRRAADIQERRGMAIRAMVQRPLAPLQRKTGKTLGAVTSGDAEMAMRKDG